MTIAEDFNQRKAAIEAVKNEDIKTCYMPVDRFVQEAEDLYQWALMDKEKLMQAGLSEELLQELSVLSGALRHAQALYTQSIGTKQKAQRAWAIASREGFALRNQLLHALRYAYRNNKSLLTRLAAIAEDTGPADMIQDLHNLAVLGSANKQPLKAINLDMHLLVKASKASDQLSDLLAKANGEKHMKNEAKITRDKTYTLLKTAVDEVRACGKYVFWKNPGRLEGYASKYNRVRRRKYS